MTFNTPLTLLSAMIATLAVVTLNGCDPAPTSPATPAVATPIDLRGVLRLSKGERDGFIAVCVNRSATFVGSSSKLLPVRRDGVQVYKEMNAAKFEQFCDCLINQLEDRSSKLQFAILMAGIRRGQVISNVHQLGDVSVFRSMAQQQNISSNAITEALQETPRIGGAAHNLCALAIEP
jgi:hypothetical protein